MPASDDVRDRDAMPERRAPAPRTDTGEAPAQPAADDNAPVEEGPSPDAAQDLDKKTDWEARHD